MRRARTGRCRSRSDPRSRRDRDPSDGTRTLETWLPTRPESTCSSSISTFDSPTSGVKPSTSPTGTSRSSRPSSAPRTARATAMRSRRSHPGSLCVDHGYRMPGQADARSPGPAEWDSAERARVSGRSGLGFGSRLDSPGGSERQSGAARHRAVGGGGARRVPAVHVDRGRRESVARSQRARRPNG